MSSKLGSEFLSLTSSPGLFHFCAVFLRQDFLMSNLSHPIRHFLPCKVYKTMLARAGAKLLITSALRYKARKSYLLTTLLIPF